MTRVESEAPAGAVTLVRGLGLLAATSIVVGGVIGTGVFLKARVMTCNVDTPWMVLAAWSVAGLLSLAGALTYAELAVLMPRAGGEYVFIRDGYGRPLAFLYGWTRFFVASTGGMAGLAAGFAIFLNIAGGGALAATPLGLPVVAAAAIALVTLVNCAAVTVGGRVATVMAILKVALVAGVGAASLLLAQGSSGHFAMSAGAGACEGVLASARGGFAGFGAAMLGAMWAYNGWNELTFLSGEVDNPRRNLPIALIGGIGILMALYLFANAAYFYVLTPEQIASVPESSAVATEAVSRFLGSGASGVMAAALAMSVFGALLVTTMASARVPYAMAADGVFFAALARVSPGTRVPVRALLAQGAWGIGLVFTGSYDVLTDYAIFAVLIFVALATASVFLFRRRMPDAERSYRTVGYPVVPILFLVVAGWLIVNTFMATPGRAMAGVGLMLAGLPFYWYWSRSAASAREL
ncbi:MAG TPA: amino acid permease [Vicinamibacterales bacterium]|nr:amino acid permease [Vicinamibacterales bacterium]